MMTLKQKYEQHMLTIMIMSQMCKLYFEEKQNKTKTVTRDGCENFSLLIRFAASNVKHLFSSDYFLISHIFSYCLP